MCDTSSVFNTKVKKIEEEQEPLIAKAKDVKKKDK